MADLVELIGKKQILTPFEKIYFHLGRGQPILFINDDPGGQMPMLVSYGRQSTGILDTSSTRSHVFTLVDGAVSMVMSTHPGKPKVKLNVLGKHNTLKTLIKEAGFDFNWRSIGQLTGRVGDSHLKYVPDNIYIGDDAVMDQLKKMAIEYTSTE